MLGVNRVIILKLIALVGWSLVCYFLLPLKFKGLFTCTA
jgi:hypothetical protein